MCFAALQRHLRVALSYALKPWSNPRRFSRKIQPPFSTPGEKSDCDSSSINRNSTSPLKQSTGRNAQSYHSFTLEILPLATKRTTCKSGAWLSLVEQECAAAGPEATTTIAVKQYIARTEAGEADLTGLLLRLTLLCRSALAHQKPSKHFTSALRASAIHGAAGSLPQPSCSTD